jgi:hypothetical protein
MNLLRLFDRWRYPHMQSHELWLPSAFGDIQFTQRVLAAVSGDAIETEGTKP